MLYYPEQMITASSNVKDAITKTFRILRSNLGSGVADTTFTYTPPGTPITGAGRSQGPRVNLVKAIIPADATILDLNVYAAAGTTPGDATSTSTLYIGAIIPFTSITSTTTTATVTTPYPHNLTTSDTIVVNGTGQANFDKAAPTAIASVPTSTTFTYTITSTNATSTIGAIGCTTYFIKYGISVLNAAQVVPTVGASPWSYTAPAVGNVIVQAGTVSAITITHLGGSAVNIGVTAGVIPVIAGDKVTITYTVAPTVTFMPAEKAAVGQLPVIAQRIVGNVVGWQPASTTAGSGSGSRGPIPIGADIHMFAMIVETGTASTAGGPWYGEVYYIR